MSSNIIFITGYAKLPSGITAQELYSVVAVGLLVDITTGIIVEADCTLVTATAKRFFKESLMGVNVTNYEEIEKIFNSRYFGSAKKALLSALRICGEKIEIIKIENN